MLYQHVAVGGDQALDVLIQDAHQQGETGFPMFWIGSDTVTTYVVCAGSRTEV